ncbi:MAG: spore maturation protein [Eubacteriales bacterium]|nr:spore maturation protein [Eubacteriales bacterium]
MQLIRLVSTYTIPLIFLFVIAHGLYKGVDIFDEFVVGAKRGISTFFRIIPPLIGLIVAIGVFRASGALDAIVYALTPIAKLFCIPREVLPLALLRPVSGSASLAMLSDIVNAYGPDSLAGRIASTMMGSTETTFYTITIYLSSVGIKKARYTLAAALIADAVCIIISVLVCTALFSS